MRIYHTNKSADSFESKYEPYLVCKLKKCTSGIVLATLIPLRSNWGLPPICAHTISGCCQARGTHVQLENYLATASGFGQEFLNAANS